MLNIQVFALSLVPLLAGAVTIDGKALIAPMVVLGIEERVSADFLVGTWKYSEEFFRWGTTDGKPPQVRTSRAGGFMTIHKDGTIEMVHLFRPAKGRWELTERGLLLYDPRFPERGTQLLQIRKRDNDHIWVLLPFSGGATGIGLMRVADRSEVQETARGKSRSMNRFTGSRPPRDRFREDSQRRGVAGWDSSETEESSADSGEQP